jgi:hypothetical protein
MGWLVFVLSVLILGAAIVLSVGEENVRKELTLGVLNVLKEL